MILKCFLVILCILIVDASAGKIDCKTIDSQKFNDLFNFKYGGGSVGLKFDFDFIGTSSSFKIQECTFEILLVKTATYGTKNFRKHASKTKLNGLQACTKYKVVFTIKNLATKKTFDYENFVSTKPDMKVSKIELSVQDVGENFADLSYLSVSADCFEKFVAVLRDNKNNQIENKTLDQNLFTFENLKSSKSYFAQVIAFDDKGGKILSNEEKFKTESSKTDSAMENVDVELQLLNVTTNEATFKWTLSDEIDLTLVYRLEVFNLNLNPFINETFVNNSATINNLLSCTEYSAKISIDNHQKSSILNFTTSSSPPSSPKNLKYTTNSTNSIISWNQPDENPNCVSSYTLKYHTVKNTSNLIQQTIARNQTTLVLDRLPFSKKIYIHVYANHDTSDNSNATRNSAKIDEEFENHNVDEFVVTTINEFRLSTTEVQLHWNFNMSYIAAEILDHFQVLFEGKWLKTAEQYINLKIEACNKNYSVIIRCTSKDGNVGPNVTYHTNLNDNQIELSMINSEHINVHQNNETLMVKWTPNEHEASCIAFYEIKFADDVFKTYESKMEINKIDACMVYQLSITPVSKTDVRGEIAYYEFETSVLAPQKPSKPVLITAENRELRISTSVSEDDKRCIDKSPTFIEVTCNSITVVKEIKRSHSQYSVDIPNLNPNTKYECIANVKNSIGISDKSDVAVFVTLQDSPQPPNEIRTQVNDNTVDVKWRANNFTGFADYYQVHVIFVKFLYNYGEHCDNRLKNVTTIKTTDTFTSIKDLHPFSQYKLKITAANVYGKSNSSEEVIFNTNPSSPSEPRNISVHFQTHVNSTITAYLAWKSPCMMKGKLSLYTITLNGYRKGVGSDKRTEASTNEQIELHDLMHGFKYDVEIQAVNQQHGSARVFGSVAKFTFDAPSGIPLEDDLKEWISIPKTIHSSTFEVKLKRRMFVSSVGDITGIIFIIFLADCTDLPQPTFGYFPSNHSLESPQNGLNCSIMYRLTDFLNNPVIYEDVIGADELDGYNVEYQIGDCSSTTNNNEYCHLLLKRENCKYGLIARVFTNSGFRDTQTVYFNLKSASPLVETPTLLLVGGSLFAVLLASLVICTICCASARRHKKQIKTKEETAEAVENLLSFTSYCVIDKNPTPKNQFDHLL